MSSNTQSSGIVATRYVKALIDLAEDAKAIKDVEKDFADLSAMVESSDDFRHFIRSPLIPAGKQSNTVLAIAKKAKFHALSVNFLNTLVHNRRLNILEGVLAAFTSELAKRRGAVEVIVETAQDLSAKQIKVLQDALSKQTGTDVSLQTKVEPSVLGGMVVTVGSQMIDDSVRGKLERLKQTMSAGSNENITLKEVS